MGNPNNADVAVEVWKNIAEDMLIAAYVPDAENMTREDALKLALERDEQAAMQLCQSAAEA
jgi:hypothetical protein